MISNVVAFLAIAATVAYGLPCGGLVGTGCGGYGLGYGAGLGVGLGTGVLPAAGVVGVPLVGTSCVTGIGASSIAAPVYTTGVVGTGLGYGLGAGSLGCGLVGGLVAPVC